MNWSYGCPKCGARLNPRKVIVLIGTKDDADMLVGFHPEPGNYEVFLPPGVEKIRGDEWQFFCPVCRANLQSEENDKLCTVNLFDGEETREVLFSRVAGEEVTFVVADRRVEQKFGEHAENYARHLIQMKYLL